MHEKEHRRKAVVMAYFDRLNAGDAEGALELFSADARIEDPVGLPVRSGREALREYVAGRVGPAARTTPGTLVAAHDDEQVAAPCLTTVGDTTTRSLGLFRVAAGRITELRAFWGTTDREPAHA